MDLGLRNKNVLITGSTNGLGKSIAKIMAEEGANVIISGRNETAAKQLAEEIKRTNQVQAIPITADLSKENAAESLFEQSIQAMGRLDILVNNAGIWPQAYVREM